VNGKAETAGLSDTRYNKTISIFVIKFIKNIAVWNEMKLRPPDLYRHVFLNPARGLTAGTLLIVVVINCNYCIFIWNQIMGAISAILYCPDQLSIKGGRNSSSRYQVRIEKTFLLLILPECRECTSSPTCAITNQNCSSFLCS
jgi:hypothetical protein